MAGGNDLVLELLAGIDRAYTRRDWEELRSLYHDEALLCTVAAYERIVGPDELIDVFRTLESTAYAIGSTSIEPIDDNAVIVSGEIRYPLQHGGIGYGHRAWVLVFKDGLLYRTRAFNSERLARATYDAEGAELGLWSAEPGVCEDNRPARRV